MNVLRIGVIFFLGMLSMWNFMRTTYVYGGFPAAYALDVGVMAFNFCIAWWTCSSLTLPERVSQ